MSNESSKRHCLTVAVEDYFQVSAFGGLVRTGQWKRFETRIAKNTERALELLREYNTTATFFALGWVADNMPEVIRRITDAGHEVATKGYFHRSVDEMSKEEFREDAIRSREALERVGGRRVVGYRVARGAITPSTLWALDVLAELGFGYDSSMYPRFFELTKEPWRRFMHRYPHNEAAPTERPAIWELPLSTWGNDLFLLPAAGGNYFRQAPHGLMRRNFQHWHETYDAPFVMYFHIWELDPEPPEISAAGPLTRLRQYRNIEKMPTRIRDYLDDYKFTGIADYLGIAREQVKIDSGAKPFEASGLFQLPGPLPAPADGRVPITIVIPCFNEEATLPYLANTLRELLASFSSRYDVRFVFVDDASTDQTWNVLHEVFKTFDNCTFLQHEQNRGVAAAILSGINAAATEIVCSIDCDCTYDPKQLAQMIPMLTPGVDMVTASPYHRDGQVLNVPAWRLALSRSLSMLYRQVLNHQFATYTSCFRVYRRDSLKDLVLEHGGFLGVAEMLGKLDQRGGHIVECPAVLEVRMLGRSKMRTIRTIGGHLRLLGSLVVDKQKV